MVLVTLLWNAQFSRHPNPPTTLDRGLVFRQKVVYLKTLKVNPDTAFRLNPTLRSSPLSTVKSVTKSLSSLGIPRSAMGRILDMLPVLLTCDPYSQFYPLLDFLLHEVPIPYPHVHTSILRCPRLLVSSVDLQLRPTLHFLQKLGFCGPHSLTSQTTLLLVSSVEDTLLPKIEFLKGLGFSHGEVANMVVRSPGLLTFSVDQNLRPKLDFFLREMKGDVADLKRFPQYFSFSLDKRIKPRHRKLTELGVSVPLEDMLKELDESHTIQTLGSLGSVLLVTIKQELLSKSRQTVVWTIVDFLESSRGGESHSQLIYRSNNGEILGVHIFGLHAADLIHEASNAIALGTRIQDIKFAVHAHTTLSEVLDKLFKSAKVQPVREHSGRASAVELVQAVNEILSAAAIKMEVEKQVLLQEQ